MFGAEQSVMLEFDQVIAPLTRDQFLADYWSKSFLAAKGKAGRFSDLLGWDELNAILAYNRAQIDFQTVQVAPVVGANTSTAATATSGNVGTGVTTITNATGTVTTAVGQTTSPGTTVGR